jgi:small subunit ribosomal protein S9
MWLPVAGATGSHEEALALEQERWYGTGHRKDARARVWILAGTGEVKINGRSALEHLRRPGLVAQLREPFEITSTEGQFDVLAFAEGGGLTGQAGAVRHGIARALGVYREDLRVLLRRSGHLTRDPRVKERKKAGFRRARRAKQFSKR